MGDSPPALMEDKKREAEVSKEIEETRQELEAWRRRRNEFLKDKITLL